MKIGWEIKAVHMISLKEGFVIMLIQEIVERKELSGLYIKVV